MKLNWQEEVTYDGLWVSRYSNESMQIVGYNVVWRIKGESDTGVQYAPITLDMLGGGEGAVRGLSDVPGPVSGISPTDLFEALTKKVEAAEKDRDELREGNGKSMIAMNDLEKNLRLARESEAETKKKLASSNEMLDANRKEVSKLYEILKMGEQRTRAQKAEAEAEVKRLKQELADLQEQLMLRGEMFARQAETITVLQTKLAGRDATLALYAGWVKPGNLI
jgi:intein/homing endonuclease